MRNHIILLIGWVLLSFFLNLTPSFANHIVLVAPFENLSGVKAIISYEVATGNKLNFPKRTFRVDKYSEAPRHILEDILVNMGIEVIERQRLDSLLLETEFGRLSGLVDSSTSVKLGKLLGADTVIMGTITDVKSIKKKFTGYGVRTRNIQVSCSVRIRLIDIKTGKISSSTTVHGSQSYMTSQFGGITNSDIAYSVLEDALLKLRDNTSFKSSLLPKGITDEAYLVDVQLSPTPENSNIEIDGVYRGGSPINIKLLIGRSYKLRISKAGYKDFKATIVPNNGLIIKPELIKESN